MKPMTGALEHGYGEGIHILDDPYLTSLLARLGMPETDMPQVRQLLRHIYQRLIGAVLGNEFPRRATSVNTRMIEFTPKGVFEGEILAPETKVVIACLVRAGVLPSEICLEVLSQVLPPKNLRLDYLSMSRVVDAEGKVVGTDDSGLKIGGPVRDAIVLIPDPMGATGGTVERTIQIYRQRNLGPAAKIITLPMIATPEFMHRMRENCPEVTVYTGRLDRGLSAPEVLKHAPGTVEGERGLTDNHYIVPGAGGVGEVLTNSWI